VRRWLGAVESSVGKPFAANRQTVKAAHEPETTLTIDPACRFAIRIGDEPLTKQKTSEYGWNIDREHDTRYVSGTGIHEYAPDSGSQRRVVSSSKVTEGRCGTTLR